MKKRNIFSLIAILLIVIGFLLIALSFVADKDNVKMESNNNDEVKPGEAVEIEKTSITYDSVYSMGLSLYGGENIKIEVDEEDERFVIKRLFLETENFEFYYVDKETGSIYTEDFITESLPTG